MIEHVRAARDKAVLVSIQWPDLPEREARECVDELARLVDTMGIDPGARLVVRLNEPHPRFLLGSGKTEEVIAVAREIGAEYVVFDDDLSPAQQRNWEEHSGLCVIDRHEVILEIFAERAFTREAVLQVELARLEYSLPRLRRRWTHLSRQRGGAHGTRGEGETQLETDRRTAVDRIARVKRELERVKGGRATMRKQRRSVPLPTGALVGYTNAGKSSLLNRLTGAGVLVEDKLFATLDPTTRRISLPQGTEVLLTDTVGFIRKLPHDLVDAFRSTLEETRLADFLVHVVDASSPDLAHQMAVTQQVLADLGCGSKPVITVFNKIDRCGPPDLSTDGAAHLVFAENRTDSTSVRVSALTGKGIEEFLSAVHDLLSRSMEHVEFHLPVDRFDLAAMIHRTGRVLEEKYTETEIRIRAHVPPKTLRLLNEFAVARTAG